jgi:hypothetical protein
MGSALGFNGYYLANLSFQTILSLSNHPTMLTWQMWLVKMNTLYQIIAQQCFAMAGMNTVTSMYFAWPISSDSAIHFWSVIIHESEWKIMVWGTIGVHLSMIWASPLTLSPFPPFPIFFLDRIDAFLLGQGKFSSQITCHPQTENFLPNHYYARIGQPLQEKENSKSY